MPNKPDFSRVFATFPKEQLEHFIKQYEADAAVLAQVAVAPQELRDNVASCTPEFLHGYLLGSLHAINTITLIHDCLAAGSKEGASVAELRNKVFVYLVCRQLAELTGCTVAELPAAPEVPEPSRIVVPG